MKKCDGTCLPLVAWTAVALSGITLVWGAVLGTGIYKKVDTLHKAIIETQYGSQANFEAVFNASMTPEARNQIDEKVQQAVEQMKAQAGEINSDSTEGETTDKGNTPLTQDEIESFLGTTPTLDNKKGEILIIEYADFLCGYCKKLHDEGTLTQLSSENENIAVAMKAIPLFGEQSEAGAKGAYCAAQVGGNYYDYLDKAFIAQATTKDAVLAIAKEMGLEESKFSACLDDQMTTTVVNGIYPAAAAKFGISGTPASVIINTSNGKYKVVGGAVPKSMFEDAIKEVQ